VSQTLAPDDTRASRAGVELAPAFPRSASAPYVRELTSQSTWVIHWHRELWGRGLGALAFLATATEAVHHRCITSTAFGGLPRDRGSTRNQMVKPNRLARRLVGRRIQLIDLLKEHPAICRVFPFQAGPACIAQGASGDGSALGLHSQERRRIVAFVQEEEEVVGMLRIHRLLTSGAIVLFIAIAVGGALAGPYPPTARSLDVPPTTWRGRWGRTS
jgi:hypothetical protein